MIIIEYRAEAVDLRYSGIIACERSLILIVVEHIRLRARPNYIYHINVTEYNVSLLPALDRKSIFMYMQAYVRRLLLAYSLRQESHVSR